MKKQDYIEAAMALVNEKTDYVLCNSHFQFRDVRCQIRMPDSRVGNVNFQLGIVNVGFVNVHSNAMAVDCETENANSEVPAMDFRLENINCEKENSKIQL